MGTQIKYDVYAAADRLWRLWYFMIWLQYNLGLYYQSSSMDDSTVRESVTTIKEPVKKICGSAAKSAHSIRVNSCHSWQEKHSKFILAYLRVWKRR